MPRGMYVCQYNGCGKSCVREDGCYRHSEVGRQNKREAMRIYKQSDSYKKRVEEKERLKKEALEREAERKEEELRKKIIEEYRRSQKGLSNKLSDADTQLEEKVESDDESHPSSCSTCTSDSEVGEDDKVEKVSEAVSDLNMKETEQIDTSEELEDLEEEGEN